MEGCGIYDVIGGIPTGGPAAGSIRYSPPYIISPEKEGGDESIHNSDAYGGMRFMSCSYALRNQNNRAFEIEI
jgi:hypothetical protein